MSKKSEKKSEQYPVELPSRNSEIKRSPIVDVTEHEIFPMKFDMPNGGVRHESGVHFEPSENITEVVATEIKPDTAEQTTHGQ